MGLSILADNYFTLKVDGTYIRVDGTYIRVDGTYIRA